MLAHPLPPKLPCRKSSIDFALLSFCDADAFLPWWFNMYVYIYISSATSIAVKATEIWSLRVEIPPQMSSHQIAFFNRHPVALPFFQPWYTLIILEGDLIGGGGLTSSTGRNKKKGKGKEQKTATCWWEKKGGLEFNPQTQGDIFAFFRILSRIQVKWWLTRYV